MLTKTRPTKWLVKLDNLKIDHLTNDGHNPVLVRLEVSFVNGGNAKDLNFWSK